MRRGTHQSMMQSFAFTARIFKDFRVVKAFDLRASFLSALSLYHYLWHGHCEHREECFVYVFARFRTGFDKAAFRALELIAVQGNYTPVMPRFCQLLTLQSAHFPLALQVAFVANQHQRNPILCPCLAKSVSKNLRLLKCRAVRYVVNNNKSTQEMHHTRPCQLMDGAHPSPVPIHCERRAVYS